jgi:2'-hydroxyisoflavone reductase
MKLLVIGGTEFVGRAFVEAAAPEHDVTVFHRGRTEPAGLPAVEHVHGDRDGGISLLQGRSFDAVVDTCGYVPRVVADAVTRLADRAYRYLFVSTLSVYPDDTPPGSDETAATHQSPFPDTEEVTGESYGPLKASCENEVVQAVNGRALLVRPGYIVGPNDPTDRFTAWVRRAASGGEMLVPGPRDEALQVIDVRDLGAFMLHLLETDATGVHNAVGPGEPLTMGEFVDTAVRAGGAGTEPVWADREFAMAFGDEEERYRMFPMWHPEYPGVHAWSTERAVGAGLTHRPIEHTIRDTLEWDRARPREPLAFGLRPEEERDLLDRWSAKSDEERR